MTSSNSSEPPLIPLFQGQESAELLFSYSRADVLNFLEKIQRNAARHTSSNHQAQLRRVCELIINFDYSNAHRCFVDGSGVLTPVLWIWHNSRTVPFYTIHDVLGYIVSVISPVPHDATALTFYLPLLVVYTRWCIVLAGRNQTDRLEIFPARTFMVWLPSDSGHVTVGTEDVPPTVGATIPKEKHYRRLKYRDQIQVKRALWMRDDCNMPIRDYFKLPASDLNISPRRSGVGAQGQLFGHCAETIPLALRIRETEPRKRPMLEGISLETRKIEVMTAYNVPNAVECIDDPCDNCKYIMRNTGADQSRFMKGYNRRKVMQQGYSYTPPANLESKRQPSRSNSHPNTTMSDRPKPPSQPHRAKSDPRDRQALRELRERGQLHGMIPVTDLRRNPQNPPKSSISGTRRLMNPRQQAITNAQQQLNLGQNGKSFVRQQQTPRQPPLPGRPQDDPTIHQQRPPLRQPQKIPEKGKSSSCCIM